VSQLLLLEEYKKILISIIIFDFSSVLVLGELTVIKFSPWFGLCLGTNISHPRQPFSLSYESFLKFVKFEGRAGNFFFFFFFKKKIFLKIVSKFLPIWGQKCCS
jgi:hypothetical protein